MDESQDMDRAYANSAFIPGSEALPALWAAQAAAFRAKARSKLAIPYGGGPAEVLDLFLPEAPPRGVMVFIHGGYWLAFGREDWSHLAAGALARGWACAIPSYPLAPGATLPEISACIVRAVGAAANLVSGPVVVTGHSAGGHLTARLANPDLAPALAPRLRRIVPISPIAELSPLLQTEMAAPLHLDAATCARESPARQPLQPGIKAHVWVGGQERPSFLWQARLLSENWGCPWTVDPGRHHFDVIDGLARPDSALTACLLDGL